MTSARGWPVRRSTSARRSGRAARSRKLARTNARLETWEFGRGWAFDKLTIEMVEPRYMPLIGYPEAWSPFDMPAKYSCRRCTSRQDGGSGRRDVVCN
jgi:hypothetical protein